MGFAGFQLISILLPDLRGGGAERVSLDLAAAFLELGFRVELVLMKAAGEFLEVAHAGISIVELDSPRARLVPFKLAKYIRDRRPAAMVANMWPLTVAAAIGNVLSCSGTRLLLVEHNTLSVQYRDWGKLHRLGMALSLRVGGRTRAVLGAVSEGVAVDLATLAGVPADRVKVLYNPIPIRPAPCSELCARTNALWGRGAHKRILTVGSLKDQKNQELLLRAFKKLDDRNAVLMIVGKGEKEDDLRRVARDLGIADRVLFAGFQSDPMPFYHTADIFVLSSNYEGLPTVMIEALSCGLPVVSTDCPSGPAEILENGRYGWLTPVGDAEALAWAIEEALRTPVDKEALKRRAAEFSPEKAAKKYLEAMELA